MRICHGEKRERTAQAVRSYRWRAYTQAVAPTKRAAQNAVVAWVFPELVETAMQAV